MNRVTLTCYLASYALALVLELLNLRSPRRSLRALALVAGAAGVAAHTIYLYARQPPLIRPFGWMQFLGWILAIYYLSGAIHHRKLSFGVFVLPLVLGLIGLGLLLGPPGPDESGFFTDTTAEQPGVWGPVHGGLILMATVGVCVAFLASVMYLIQSHRLRTKTPPGQGLRLLSLERLETMSRRAVFLAFPLLTGGVVAGVILILKGSEIVGWDDPRVLSTGVLWVVFALLLAVRLGHLFKGRQVALMTIAAFVLLVCCLAISHAPTRQGG